MRAPLVRNHTGHCLSKRCRSPPSALGFDAHALSPPPLSLSPSRARWGARAVAHCAARRRLSLARSHARSLARSHARTSPWLPVRSLAASALAPESASAETAELRRRDCGAAMAAAHAARAATDAGSAGAQVGSRGDSTSVGRLTAACFQTLAGAQPLPLLKEDERAREVRVRRAPCARASTRPRPQPSPGSLALPRSARAAGVRIRPVQDRPGVAWRALSSVKAAGRHALWWVALTQWHSAQTAHRTDSLTVRAACRAG